MQNCVMVICAHSDDQIFGCGATLAKYAKDGKKIVTVILSYGEDSLPWLQEKITIKVRVKESHKVDRYIGGSGVYFFDLEERNFLSQIKNKKVFSHLKKLLAIHKPYRIFTHSENDLHPDHRQTHAIVRELVRKSRRSMELYCFDVWSPLSLKHRDHPQLYVDVTETFQEKIKMLKMFKSQWISLWMLMWNVYLKGIMYGMDANTKFAERFYLIEEP